MKMRDDKERVVELQIERHRREHHARQSAHDKDAKESEHEDQRRLEVPLAEPQRRDPAKDLNAVRDRRSSCSKP